MQRWVSLSTKSSYHKKNGVLPDGLGDFSSNKKTKKVENLKEMFQAFQRPVSVSVIRELSLIVFTRNFPLINVRN